MRDRLVPGGNGGVGRGKAEGTGPVGASAFASGVSSGGGTFTSRLDESLGRSVDLRRYAYTRVYRLSPVARTFHRPSPSFEYFSPTKVTMNLLGSYVTTVRSLSFFLTHTTFPLEEDEEEEKQEN